MDVKRVAKQIDKRCMKMIEITKIGCINGGVLQGRIVAGGSRERERERVA